MWAAVALAMATMGGLAAPALAAGTVDAQLSDDCFWFGPRGFAYTDGAHAANNYPDADATYWFARFTLPAGSQLELKGRFPHARYMSLSSYVGKDPAGALLDAAITPDRGSLNPFRPGARRDRPDRAYTVSIVAAPKPATPAPNTLYTGTDSADVALGYRVYVNDRGTDVAGDGGLPQPTLVTADGTRITGAAACAAVNRPDHEVQTSPPMTLEQFNALLTTPGLDPATAPASPTPTFQRFFNGAYNFLGDFRPQTRTTLTPPDTGGAFSNGDSRYVYTSINRQFGPVLVLHGTLPRTPDTRDGQRVMGSGDLRYWSLCSNKTPVSGQAVDCVTDDQVALRGARRYTIVVSRPEDRPANATSRCGVTWLDWGRQTESPADPDYGLLLLRNMVAAPGFAQAAQRVTTYGTERQVMGDYLPTASYTTTAGFQREGCATVKPKRRGSALRADAAQTAYRDGLAAYTHAFPVLMHRLSQRTFPLNTLVSINALSKPADRLIVLPNVDTVYTVGKLDLRDGPLVVHVPAHGDRYFELQLMDAYTNVSGYIGTRTTGVGPGDYVIVGPGNATPLPAGMPVLHSPTADALLLGRTLVNSPTELPMLKGFLAGYTLGPLGGEAKPSTVLDARPTVPPPTLPTGLAFFDLFDQILAEDPPTAAEARALAPLARYGIGPGLSATGAPLTPAVRAALERAVRDGRAHIEALVAKRRQAQVRRNQGWSAFDPQVGAFGTDWDLRAMTALIGLWANTPDEAVYLIAANDAQGRKLSGRHRYALTFRTPPPARAFWSLTMYDADLGLIDNPIGRQALGDRDLGRGPVTIRLQHDAPSGRTANWLPAPRGTFVVSLRLYVPERAALDGRWRPPGIRCLDCR